jgi:hypothetical protein
MFQIVYILDQLVFFSDYLYFRPADVYSAGSAREPGRSGHTAQENPPLQRSLVLGRLVTQTIVHRSDPDRRLAQLS